MHAADPDPPALSRLAAAQQRRRELPQLRARELTGAGEYLDADVVGAGPMVLRDPVGDRAGIPPGHHGVDQPIAGGLVGWGAGDVLRGEAQALPVAGVVG